MNQTEFAAAFTVLTGNPPFPWQWELYDKWFRDGKFPSSCNLPTGLGKTLVVAIWLIALANHPDKMPRRLVYVVNRRTVVDQTTNEVEKIRANLPKLHSPLDSLALSTLRGPFADNREWCADPSRPAVICGTVDTIGSRLLFSGYGCGFKSRPLHAGFLGQDVLFIHDESNLEPAFQKLVVDIESEQKRYNEFAHFKVMELSATSRDNGEVFELTTEEKNPPRAIPDPPTEPIHVVWRRLQAKKGIHFHLPVPRKEVSEEIGKLARRWKSSGKAILVFVRTINDVETVRKVLTDKKEDVLSDQVQTLTGTLRGLERDRLTREDKVFRRFLLQEESDGRTVYLICTSAGEVGVDISADHLVCDLATLDSMAQRLGRVNRRGGGAAEIDLVYESDRDLKKKDSPLEQARWATLSHLSSLPACDWIADRYEASPHEVGRLIWGLTQEQRTAAFTPLPTFLETSDILFDAWALTTIRDVLPGRPPVESYLHGLSEWEPPQTSVAWRDEVWVLRLKFKSEEERQERESEERKRLAKFASELLDDYPLKPHELLKDRTDRVFKQIEMIAKRFDGPVWLIERDESLRVTTLAELVVSGKEELSGATLLLPPAAGGLLEGTLNGGSETADDVAVHWFADDEGKIKRRDRIWDGDEPPKNMRLVRAIDTDPEREDDREESNGKRYWLWYVRPASADDDGSKTANKAVRWQVHTDDVEREAVRIARALSFSEELQTALTLAARFHDLGKKRELWQRSIGNPNPKDWLAKSGGKMKPREWNDYRHEFGSLLDVMKKPEFKELTNEHVKDLILHLIAVHHGYGRPHFPEDRAFDPERLLAEADEMAGEVPRRFAKLQRRYGRWGLAYLESLLRAADIAASQNPSEVVS